ncbi:CPBP family intramembrane glutamic endopeptidase [Dietzia sp.]|uniref:CPBP family intramembrane glutamic endopeptidase n=1 Tax=Dietzia sp. TaxID=1871616 RepID=UPI002FD925A0
MYPQNPQYPGPHQWSDSRTGQGVPLPPMRPIDPRATPGRGAQGWGPAAQRWASPLSGRFAVFAIAKVTALGVGFIAVLVLAAVAVSLARDSPPSGVALGIVILAASSVVMLLGLWAFVAVPLCGCWDLLGARAPERSMWNLLWQIPALLVAALVIELVLVAPFHGADGEQGAGGGASDLVAGQSLPVVAIALVLMCGLVPVWEELVFRGLLFGALRTRFSRWAAVAIAGCAFGAIHFLPTALPYLAVMGMGLCLLAEWYRSIVPGIVVHSVNNAIVVILVLGSVSAG